MVRNYKSYNTQEAFGGGGFGWWCEGAREPKEDSVSVCK